MKSETKLFSELTSIHIGGEIANFFEPTSIDELKEIVQEFPDFKVIGNGTNILPPSTPYDKAVIRLNIKDVPKNYIPACADLRPVTEADDCPHYLEYLFGIPGTVGGATVQNSGAFGYSFDEFVKSVQVLNSETLNVEIIEDFAYDYRTSIFKQHPELVVIAVELIQDTSHLKRDMYFSLATVLQKEPDAEPSKHDILYSVITQRQHRGTMYDPNNPETYSAGSFFKNPVINGYRQSAADLIDSVRFYKGFSENGLCKLSEQNVGVIVNNLGASQADVLHLAHTIQQDVKETKNFDLDYEVEIL